MTLILSKTCELFTLQVSDRLVSQDGAAVDLRFNKSIVIVARDAILSAAFTGNAEIGGIPTDQWIAERLIGEPFDRSRKPPALSFGRQTKITDIGSCWRTISRALESAAGHVRPEHRADWVAKSFDFCFTGWQWNARGRARPVVGSIGKNRGVHSFHTDLASRHYFRRGRFRVAGAPAENIRQSDLASVAARVASQLPDVTEYELAEHIRRVANRMSVVGEDCLSVLLLPPSIGKARIRYLPARTSTDVTPVGARSAASPVAFTPWIVGPSMVMAPSRMIETHTCVCGPYTILIEGPEVPGLSAALSGQPRQPLP